MACCSVPGWLIAIELAAATLFTVDDDGLSRRTHQQQPRRPYRARDRGRRERVLVLTMTDRFTIMTGTSGRDA